ncbi:MAG: S8 family serine peptidase [Actinomycetota bacterium]
MRTPTTIALTVAMTCATVQSSVSAVAASPLSDGSITVEVIVREDVAEGEAPSFEVVETDLGGLVEMLADPDDGTTIEPNGSAWITATPPDPQAVNQWAIAANAFASAWDTTTGNGDITIAVLDTGVDASANLGDRLLPGISFVDGDPSIDPTGHGSWVAALTAAAHDDVGVAGVCPDCSILPVQVGDQFGRVPWSAAAEGITWAVDQGADIINLSFGGGTRSDTLADAVAYAVANDVIVIGAAGNNGSSDEFYPAAFDGVVSVAAHDPNYGAYSWSNHGAWVDIAAAGCSVGAVDEGYSGICGTSFAAPVVAGTVGLLFDHRGALTTDVVEAVLEAATNPVDYVETGWIDAATVLTVDPETVLVEEPAPVVAPASAMPFVDVDPGAYYAEPVAWLVATGATAGTSPTTFSPDATVTRGQLATFLWRLEGEPDPVTEVAAFADVDPGAYYAQAVAWLASTGVTTGTSPTTFSPDATVTRGQLATFLWRMDGSPSVEGATSAFADVDPGAYYADPVTWLAAVGITAGTSPTTFSPQDTVTRGQLATFLWRRAHLGE